MDRKKHKVVDPTVDPMHQIPESDEKKESQDRLLDQMVAEANLDEEEKVALRKTLEFMKKNDEAYRGLAK